jgi:hypothetical protein
MTKRAAVDEAKAEAVTKTRRLHANQVLEMMAQRENNDTIYALLFAPRDSALAPAANDTLFRYLDGLVVAVRQRFGPRLTEDDYATLARAARSTRTAQHALLFFGLHLEPGMRQYLLAATDGGAPTRLVAPRAFERFLLTDLAAEFETLKMGRTELPWFVDAVRSQYVVACGVWRPPQLVPADWLALEQRGERLRDDDFDFDAASRRRALDVQ